MMKRIKILAALAVAALTVQAAGGIRVHTIGDSTMADYDENATVTRGWGMYLQQFLEGITVNNRGKGGADTRGFFEGEALWPTVKRQMQEGDYVLIQFAHNDEKNGGMDGVELRDYYLSIGDDAKAAATDTRGTVPARTYREYLRRFIDETRAMGCHPVLVAPVCRSYFTGSTIRRNGRHDLGDNFSLLTADGPTQGNKVSADDHTMDYAWQMRLVAEETGVPFIDLTTATRELYESYGDTRCHELLFDGTGSTHFNATGATLTARLCAQLMQEQGILADHIRLTADITVSPAEGDFGEAYVGQTLQREFSLSGFSLSPESGTVSLSATGGVELSADGQQWAPSLTVAYSASMLIQTFHARLTLTGEGAAGGTITVSHGGRSLTIPVTATAVATGDGQEVCAYWRLESDATCRLTGPATVVDESWQGMYVQRYASPNASTTWPAGTGFDASRKTQRNLIVGDDWPDGDIDENPARYIQFGVTAPEGVTLKIDSIGMYVCGAGGNGMMCHVNYSTDPSFADQHTIYAPSKMVANTMEAVSARPVVTLDAGQTLLVRIYPWYSSAATGKTICISDVTIHGYAVTPSAVHGAVNDAPAARTSYYNMCGMAAPVLRPGLNIVRRELAGGRVATRKVMAY